MYSEGDIQNFRKEAKRYNLKAPREFWFKQPKYLKEHCNGVGSADMAKIIVKALTVIYKKYQVAAVIHDVDYLVQRVTKQEADQRFYDNMLKIWEAEYGWKRFLPLGLRDFFRIRAAYVAVRDFGQSAWDAAVDKNSKCKDGDV